MEKGDTAPFHAQVFGKQIKDPVQRLSQVHGAVDGPGNFVKAFDFNRFGSRRLGGHFKNLSLQIRANPHGQMRIKNQCRLESTKL
jgi:hypothetical protein